MKNTKTVDQERAPSKTDLRKEPHKFTFQPETSIIKALSIYGGSKSPSSSSKINKSQSITTESKKVVPKDSKTMMNNRSPTKKQQVESGKGSEEVQKDNNLEINKDLLKQLPQEVVLEILDYVPGIVFKACLIGNFEKTQLSWSKFDCNTLEFNEPMFYRQYFGKFVNSGDTSPKLIFKRAAVPHNYMRSPKEFHHLLSLMVRNNMPIDAYIRMLCIVTITERKKEGNLIELENKMLKYITTVFGNNKEVCEKITTLDVCGFETFESFVNFAATNFPNLEKLKLGFKKPITKGYMFYKTFNLQLMESSLLNLSKIKDFNYCGTNFNYEFMEEFSKATPLVERFSVTSGESLVKCGKAILNWKNLKEINGVMFTPTYMRHVASTEEQTEFLDALKDLSLEKLSLHNDVVSVTTDYSFPSSITHLDLQQTVLSTQLIQNIGTLQSLKVLALDCCSGFQKEDFKYLKNLAALEELSVTQSSNCGDIGVKHIAEIASLKRVYLLNLSKDQIHDEGGLALAKLENLEIVDLQFCEISEQTIITLAEKCSKLQNIYVNGCKKINKTKLVPKIKKLLDEVCFFRAQISLISEE